MSRPTRGEGSRSGTGSRPGIFAFPVEVLFKIFQHVQVFTGFEDDRTPESINDLKNCRLTCRQFNTVSSELLIPALEIDCSPKSLEILERIAAHPTIGRGLLTIRFRFHQYSPVLSGDFRCFIDFSLDMLEQAITLIEHELNTTPSAHEQLLQAKFHRLQEARRVVTIWTWIRRGYRYFPSITTPEANDVLHERLLTQAHLDYQILLYEQGLCLNGTGNESDPQSRFLSRVAAALARLPWLRTLQFTDKSHPPKPQRICQRILRESTTDLYTIIYQEIVTPAEDESERWFENRPFIHLGDIIPGFFAHLSDARHLHPDYTSRLKVLSINTATIDLARFSMDPITRAKVSSELSSLKSFSLETELRSIYTANPPTQSTSHATVINTAALNDWLRIPLASPILERFDLTISGAEIAVSSPDDSMERIPDIGPALLSRRIPFPVAHLRLFRLSGVAFHERDMVTFLETTFRGPDRLAPNGEHEQAAGALRLELQNARLLSGSWANTRAALVDARRRMIPGGGPIQAQFMVIRGPHGELAWWR